MGQYYNAIILNDKKTQPKAWVYSHDIKFPFKRADGSIYMMGNGVKLMEHSWIKNEFVQKETTIIRSMMIYVKSLTLFIMLLILLKV